MPSFIVVPCKRKDWKEGHKLIGHLSVVSYGQTINVFTKRMTGTSIQVVPEESYAMHDRGHKNWPARVGGTTLLFDWIPANGWRALL